MVPRLTENHRFISKWRAEDDRLSCEKTSLPVVIPSDTQVPQKTRWRQRFKQLVRMSIRSNVQPKIGERCLIMTGIAGEDEGQMGVVTKRTRVMVEVSFVPKCGEGIISKNKHPRSLIMLEAGLVLMQDPDGSVWVRTSSG
jgi:hypothetical protein